MWKNRWLCDLIKALLKVHMTCAEKCKIRELGNNCSLNEILASVIDAQELI